MKIEVSKPTAEQKKFMLGQPIWEHEAATFPWHYDDKETCLILEGKVTVKTAGQSVDFGAGDYIVFPKGLDCEWMIHEKVRKHYKFG